MMYKKSRRFYVNQEHQLYKAYFEAKKADATYDVKVCHGDYHKYWEYEETWYEGFNAKKCVYIVMGFHHFNAHFSGFTDECNIFGLWLAKIREE